LAVFADDFVEPSAKTIVRRIIGFGICGLIAELPQSAAADDLVEREREREREGTEKEGKRAHRNERDQPVDTD